MQCFDRRLSLWRTQFVLQELLQSCFGDGATEMDRFEARQSGDGSELSFGGVERVVTCKGSRDAMSR
jgi:hypothetical protein